jgi:hypothetical protein
MNYLDSLTLAPLSAGDIIDRSVRLYRRHFITLLRIVLVPSLSAYAGWIACTVGWRGFTLSEQREAQFLLNLVLVVGGLGLFFAGKIAFYVMLGGTSRALVNHFLDGSPLRARDVFRAVRERVWSLIGAVIMVLLLLISVAGLISNVFLVIIVAYAGVVGLISNLPLWIQATIHAIFGGLFAVGLLALLLLIYGRIIYVPQALMVEGKGVFSALSRSFTLAGRDLRRIGAIFLFEFYVAWSLLLLLVIPFDAYAYLRGVDITPFVTGRPLWYSIAYQTLTQVSEILLAPTALLGFTLLYIDSRVRKEGFDIELLANRYLPAVSLIPPPEIRRPLPATTSPFPSILGLNDYRPARIQHSAPTRGSTAALTPATRTAPDSSICHRCGTGAGAGDLFCRHCGEKI